MFRLAALALLILSGCSESVSPRAERVFYRDSGMAAWGTVCRLNQRGFLGMGERGYISVAHVTENGTPLVGPKDAVTVSDSVSDWSFLGVDPAQLDPADYPPMRSGQAVEIHGFPARDRDGEVIPGIVYTDDPKPPFWWIELHDSDDGIAAEGVIGGFSGSCVFDEAGALLAVVHANGFSRIEGTTHTWAMVVPVRAAILQAQGSRTPETPTAPATMIASQEYREVSPIITTQPAYQPVEPVVSIDTTPPTYTAPAYAAIMPPQPQTGIIETVPLPYPDPLPSLTVQPPVQQTVPAYRIVKETAWRRCANCL